MNGSDLKNKLKQASERLKQAVKECLEAIARMQKDMAEDFAITNVVERLKEFMVHPAKGKRRTYPPYRERLHAQKPCTRKPYWHRVRSNPKRRRKPH